MRRVGTVSRWTLGFLLVLVLLWRMLSLYGNRGSNPSYASDAGRALNPALLAPAGSARRGTHVADSLALTLRRHDSADGAFEADITVTNGSATPVKDLAIACDALDENGTTIGHAGTTLDSLFAAHSTKTVAKVTVTFLQRNVASARCAIADFVIAG